MELSLIVLIILVSVLSLPIVFELFNLIFLSMYCRLKRKSDRKRLMSQNNSAATKVSGEATIAKKPNPLKRLFEKIDPYFYGWMRYQTIVFGRIPSHRLRRFLYRRVFCMQITKRTVIYGGCEIRSPWNIKADRCVISTYCVLDGRNGITFENDVVLGGGVHIWTEEHNVNDSNFGVLPENKRGVLIKRRAWICSDSTILPGVVVEEGCVLATRGCLTKNTLPFGVYAGIPAVRIKDRNKELNYELNGKPTWHYY